MRKLEDEKSSISAERQQLTKDRSQFLKEKEAYKQELKSLKKEKKTFEDDQKEFATTKANCVDNLNQDDSSKSSHSSDSSSTSSRRTTRSYKLPASVSLPHINSLPLPKFDGRQDLDKWLYIVDTQLELLNVPKRMQLKVVSPHFAGLALELLLKYAKVDHKNSWTKFKKELNKLFKTRDHDNKIRNEILSIKHYGNFDSFTRKFLSLLNQAPDEYNEEERFFHFTRALST
jgi:hypothetical protein